ncbi:magnesium transporter [Candidatus Uhrbacteria bacterium]|nr:magnesium transporter [Candidatus Uhrbacteria bacterium]
MNHRIIYADEDKESVQFLLRLRLPALLVGLVLGISTSFLTSRFEQVLAANVKVAFFIPFVVYIADAIGTQTESIYTRDLKSGKAKFSVYLFKESLLGLLFGLLFATASYIFILFWIGDSLLALGVSVAVLMVCTIAPLVALFTTKLLHDLHEDPAVGSGPIATVIQDAISILIYGAILSIMIL